MVCCMHAAAYLLCQTCWSGGLLVTPSYSRPTTPPPPLCPAPPPLTVIWPMNNKKSIGNHRRRRSRRKILVGYTRFQVIVVWCPSLPGAGGNRHLLTVPPGVGGNRRPWGGGGSKRGILYDPVFSFCLLSAERAPQGAPRPPKFLLLSFLTSAMHRFTRERSQYKVAKSVQ